MKDTGTPTNAHVEGTAALPKRSVPVQHMPAVLSALLNQKAEGWIQLRRATGQIDRSSPGCAYEFEGQSGRPRSHDLGPFRTGINMTVEAGLVAQLTQVDLNGLQLGPFEGQASLLA